MKRQNRKLYSIYFYSFLSVAVGVFSSCGAIDESDRADLASPTESSHSASGVHHRFAAASDGFEDSSALVGSCEYRNNIKPDYDWDLSGDGTYTACLANDVGGSVFLSGYPLESSNVCLIPAQLDSFGRAFPVLNQETGEILSNCTRMSSNPYKEVKVLLGSGLSYNGMFIVDQARLSAMKTCLTWHSYYQVPFNPKYSYGNHSSCPRDFSLGNID